MTTTSWAPSPATSTRFRSVASDGWVTAARLRSQTVTETGQYALEPYATPNGGLPKALRIFKSTAGSSNTYIYAEARTQHGADGSLAPGVVIHTGVDSDGSQGYLYDLQPSSPVTDFILNPGQSVTFRQRAARDGDGSVVRRQRRGPGRDRSLHLSLGSSGQSVASAGGPGSVALNTDTECALGRDERFRLAHGRCRQHERHWTVDHPVHRRPQHVGIGPDRHADDRGPDVYRHAGWALLQLHGVADEPGVQPTPAAPARMASPLMTVAAGPPPAT